MTGASYALVMRSTRRLVLASLAAILEAEAPFSFVLTFFWAVLGSSEDCLGEGMAWWRVGVEDMYRMLLVDN